MIQRDLKILSEQTEQFCQTPGFKLIIDPQAKDLLRDILHGIHENPSQRSEYTALIEQLRIACDCSEKLMSSTIGSIAYRLYDSDSPALAETAFRLAVEIAPESGVKNNLAYICRRHRDVLHTSDVEIIDLLMDGVQERNPFSLVNMALHFSRNLATDEDWKLADQMIRLIKPDDSGISSVVKWWKDLAQDEDDEGLLVLRWLERHKKHESPHITPEHYAALRKRCPDIPQWIFEPYTNK